MKKINWTAILVTAILALLAFQIIAGFMGGWNYGGWGMMGPGMMGRWGYSPFGWFGMFFMWLIPVGFIVLVALGVSWLARNLGGGTPPASQACPSCGRGVQADWRNCPHCGAALAT